jgi:outer membrane protein assembly factor BamB
VRAAIAVIAAFALGALTAACPGPAAHPRGPGAQPITLEIGRDGGSLRGVAGDGALTFSAITSAVPATDAGPSGSRTIVEARRGAAVIWHQDADGSAGPVAVWPKPAPDVAGRVFVALAGTGSIAGAPVRGEPGSAVVALDLATGKVGWRVALDASEWAVISSIAAGPDGVIVGGSFGGSLRIRDKVVSSAGKGDGFVAKLALDGRIAWLVRIGGANADAVQGVATHGARIAIAGTFAAGADLLGQPLPPFDDKSPFSDGFVAELDATGHRVWAATFGGKLDDAVAGVAIDASGRVAVAATARDTIHLAGADLVARGAGDGLVAWWAPDGSAGHAVLIGGEDFDGLRAITAVGDRIVIGGFYSGTLELAGRSFTAGGGDDAFLAAVDDHGAVVDAWAVSGSGREEITALSAVPGGFIAGVAHTADATVDGDALPSPKDPMSGAAIVVRAVR